MYIPALHFLPVRIQPLFNRRTPPSRTGTGLPKQRLLPSRARVSRLQQTVRSLDKGSAPRQKVRSLAWARTQYLQQEVRFLGKNSVFRIKGSVFSTGSCRSIGNRTSIRQGKPLTALAETGHAISCKNNDFFSNYDTNSQHYPILTSSRPTWTANNPAATLKTHRGEIPQDRSAGPAGNFRE